MAVGWIAARCCVRGAGMMLGLLLACAVVQPPVCCCSRDDVLEFKPVK